MVQIIRNGGLPGIFLSLILMFLSKVFFEVIPDAPQVTYTPLFASLKTMVSGPLYLDMALGVTFLFLQSLLLNRILNIHKVIREKSLFPMVLFFMVAGVYNEQFYLNPASFLNFFLILITERMLKLQDIGKNPGSLFLDIGTLLGCSLLFSKEAMFYIPVVVIGVIIVYTYSANNIIILLFSAFMIMFMTGCIYFLAGQFDQFWSFFTFTPIQMGLNYTHWQERFYILLILIGLLSVLSFMHFQFSSKMITNKSRRFAGVFDMFWGIALLIVVFQQLNLWYNMALFAVPLSVFGASYFQEERGINMIKNLVFLIFLSGLMAVQLNY